MRAVSDDRIAHIIVVRQLHTVEQYAVFQLGRVSDNAAAPCDDVSAQKSAAAIQGGMVPFYLVLFAALDLHIAIGLYRIGVKFGILTRENRLKWRKYALYLVIGLALLSLATHYSFATMAI